MPTIFITGISDGIGQAPAATKWTASARVLELGRRPFPAALTGVMQPADYCQIDLAQTQPAGR